MHQPVAMKKPAIPQLVNTRKAAEILGRSAATLKRWRAEGVGPNWIEVQGRVSYDVNVLLEYIQKNTRVASVRAAMEDKYYWYDFTVRGQRYRGSTNETKAAKTAKIGGLKLAQRIENTDPLPKKPPVLLEFSQRFLEWLDNVKCEDKTKA